MRIVFMGSPGPAVPALEHLIEAGFNIAAVYTRPDRPMGRGLRPAPPPVKEAAGRLGLPVLQPATLKDAAEVKKLADIRPDVIVICAYGEILPQEVIDLPARQCLNLHFSLLPRHRGAAPVVAALLAGDEFTGVSVQLVRKKLDSGPLLSQAAVPIAAEDDAGSLTSKLALVGAHLLLESLTGWLRGEIVPRPQDESAATYCRQITKEAGRIDWQLPALNIQRMVRAFSQWPGSYTSWKGKKLNIIRAVVLEGQSEVGRVISMAGSSVPVAVGTGKGLLGIGRLQLEGRKELPAGEFLKGARDFIGSLLPS